MKSHIASLFAMLVLAACGGGGGDSTNPPGATSYVISTTAASGGTISPATANVANGATATFTITPNTGFDVAAASGCGGTLTGSTFTTAAVTSNCSISVSFGASITGTGADGLPSSDSDLSFARFLQSSAPGATSTASKSIAELRSAATSLGEVTWMSQYVEGCEGSLSDGETKNGYCGFAVILMAANYLLEGKIRVAGRFLDQPAPPGLGYGKEVGNWIVATVKQVFGNSYGDCASTGITGDDFKVFANKLGLGSEQFDYSAEIKANGDDTAKQKFLRDWVTDAYQNNQAVVALVPYQGDKCALSAAQGSTPGEKRANYYDGGAKTVPMIKCSGRHYVLVRSMDQTSVLVYDPDPLAENAKGGIRRYTADSFWNALALPERRTLYRFCRDDLCDLNKAFTLPQPLELLSNVLYTTKNSEPVAKPLVSGQVRFSAMGMPEGLTMEEDGRIVGQTASTGHFRPLITMQQSTGGAAERTALDVLELDVRQSSLIDRILFWVAQLLPQAKSGAHYFAQLGSNLFGAPPTYTLESGTLPPGLTLEGSHIEGIPTQAGTYNFELRATSATGSSGSTLKTTASKPASAAASAVKSFTIYVAPATGAASPTPSIDSLEPAVVIGADRQQAVILHGQNLGDVSAIILTDTTNGGEFWKTNLITKPGGSEISLAANFTSKSAVWTATAVAASGVRSGAFTFQVSAPAQPPPVLTVVSPASVVASANEQSITLAGSNFRSNARVEVLEPATGRRANATVTQASGQQLVAAFAFDVPASWAVRVINTDNSSSAPLNLVVKPAPSAAVPARPNASAPGSEVSPGPTTPSTSISLNWSAIAGAAFYEIGVRDLSSGELVVDATATTNSLAAALQPGRPYRWNVAACNSAGCSGFTPPLYFQTPGALQTIPPTPSGAKPGSSLSPGPTTSGASVLLSWDASAGATRYDLGVRDMASGDLVVSNTNVASTSLIASLAAGRLYRWNVSACNAAGCSSFTTPLYFQTPGSSPRPAISGVSPSSYPANTSNQTMIISGSNFTSGATLTFDPPTGSNISSTASKLTFVSSGQIQYDFNNGGDAGTWAVRVNNPDGQSSDFASFSVATAPAAKPAISSVSPSSYPASTSNQTMTINGSNFVSGATLIFNPPTGSNINSTASKLTFVSSSQIQYDFNNGADAGSWTVMVRNPDGQESDPASFAVTAQPAAEPSISSISPSSYPASNSNQTMVINGSHFVSGATLTFNPPTGSNIDSTASKLTFNSSSKITYDFNNGGDDGTWTVRVNNPDGQRSDAVSFSVTPATAPAPSISSLSPSSYPASNSNQTMTINGSNFVSGATLIFDPPTGSNINSTASKLTFNSSSKITYDFNNGSDRGTWSVTVKNPDGQQSSSKSFTVN